MKPCSYTGRTTVDEGVLDQTTRIGLGIIFGLAASAAAVIVIVVAGGAPIWAGLLILAVLDVVIIGWGYKAGRRSLEA